MNTTNNDFSLGQRLRQIRKSKRITVRELAEKACLSKTTISDIECGINSNPTAATATKIARALDISVSALYSDGLSYTELNLIMFLKQSYPNLFRLFITSATNEALRSKLEKISALLFNKS